MRLKAKRMMRSLDAAIDRLSVRARAAEERGDDLAASRLRAAIVHATIAIKRIKQAKRALDAARA